ncbi:hypothetical protein [Anaeromyxobacter diazotrophicus]|uniref:Uncharacterized protein n=1 Tax=Anaeromyxobacter diazotrophicus TaxID=2590199 RepID=A0A7I9VGY9_9BACT|nr:hypothetical protein [Anaeromyxobacter diazotrophicus]GEJ55662.1 hypothetical protein AMYX_04030 [Anaeromyxobacter diazotrophicus]
MTSRSQHGSALLFTLLVMTAILAVAVAMIRYSALELSASTAGRKQQELVACAEAGRTLLLSKFKLLGAPVTEVLPLNVALDSRTQLAAGHYDGASVVQVSPLPAWAAGPTKPSTANWRIQAQSLGGTPYKVVVHCQVGGDGTPTSGRQLEVEFGIRFGL